MFIPSSDLRKLKVSGRGHSPWSDRGGSAIHLAGSGHPGPAKEAGKRLPPGPVTRPRIGPGQAKSSHTAPVREAVVVQAQRHGLEDLRKAAKALELEREFGMEVLRAHVHRDEGTGEAALRKGPSSPVQAGKTIKGEDRNRHGHILAKWVDGQGET